MAKGERKKNTENKQKMPFSWGKTRFFSCIKQPKKQNQQKKNKTKNNQNKKKRNKEGLGPSEVALWATSPDP